MLWINYKRQEMSDHLATWTDYHKDGKVELHDQEYLDDWIAERLSKKGIVTQPMPGVTVLTLHNQGELDPLHEVEK